MKFFDTNQEKKIGAGISWPFHKLKPYECVISEDYSKHKGVKLGDKIAISVTLADFWNVLRHEYNEKAETEGFTTVP